MTLVPNASPGLEARVIARMKVVDRHAYAPRKLNIPEENKVSSTHTNTITQTHTYIHANTHSYSMHLHTHAHKYEHAQMHTKTHFRQIILLIKPALHCLVRLHCPVFRGKLQFFCCFGMPFVQVSIISPNESSVKKSYIVVYRKMEQIH